MRQPGLAHGLTQFHPWPSRLTRRKSVYLRAIRRSHQKNGIDQYLAHNFLEMTALEFILCSVRVRAEAFEPIHPRWAQVSRYLQLGVVGALSVTVGDAFMGGEVSSGVHLVGLCEDVLGGGEVGQEILVGASSFVGCGVVVAVFLSPTGPVLGRPRLRRVWMSVHDSNGMTSFRHLEGSQRKARRGCLVSSRTGRWACSHPRPHRSPRPGRDPLWLGESA